MKTKPLPSLRSERLKTAHLVRVTQPHIFSRVSYLGNIINAHALAQSPTVKDMWIVCLCVLIQSHSFASGKFTCGQTRRSLRQKYTVALNCAQCRRVSGTFLFGHHLPDQPPWCSSARSRWGCPDATASGGASHFGSRCVSGTFLFVFLDL